MTRKVRWVTILVVVSSLGAGCLAAGSYVVFKRFQGQKALLRAEQAYSEGRWSDAKMNYRWYLARHPGDPNGLRKYTESCLRLLSNRQANLQDAGRAYLQMALAKRTDDTLVREAVDFYREHSLWQELEYATDLFLREDSGNAFLCFNKALALDRLGRPKPAIEAYQRLLESGQPPFEVYGNLAILLKQQGLPEQGWQVLEDAFAKKPEEPLIRVERARYLMADKNPARAAGEIDAALAGGAKSGEAFLAAAYVYTAKKDWPAAQTAAEKAIGVNPAASEGYFLVANSHLARREPEKAIAFLSGVDPFVLADNPQLYLMLAEVQIDAGLLDKVGQTVDSYRTAYPNNQYVFDYLAARKLIREGRASEAAPKLEVVVQQVPELRAARYFLALAYLETGQRDRAKNTLEMYLKGNPEDERARAVWDATFAERSAAEVETSAAEMLSNEETPSASLLSAAYALAQDGGRTNKSGKRVELAKHLLERVIERTPSMVEPYRGLLSICLDGGDLEGARQVLVRAKEAVSPGEELRLLEAGCALAESKPEQARAYFEEECALGNVTPQRALKWAELFARRGHLEGGLALIESLRAKGSGVEDDQQLGLGETALCIRFGDHEKALNLIGALAAKYADSPETVKRLNDSRMAMAGALLSSEAAPDKAAAERLLAEVEQSEAARTDVKVLRARLLLEKDPPDVDGAEQLCAAAGKEGASGANVYLLSAEVASRKGQLANALDYTLKASAAAPDDVNVLMALVRAQLQMDRFADAATTLEKLRANQPANTAILELLGRAYAGAGRFSEAESIMNQLEKVEGGPSTVPLRAWLFISRGEWTGAAQLLRQMHDANPDDLWTIHFLAKAMTAQAQGEQAEEFLNACIARRPKLPELRTELGSYYLATGDMAKLSKASAAYTQALVQQAGYLPALRGVLEVQVRSGNLGGALGLCKRFLKDNPDDPDMLEQKASLLAQLPGSQQEALDTIQQAVEIRESPEFFSLRACLRVNLGKFSEAIDDFQRASQAGVNASANMDSLRAEAYLGLNNKDLARFYHDSARQKASKGERVDIARLDRLETRLAEEKDK